MQESTATTLKDNLSEFERSASPPRHFPDKELSIDEISEKSVENKTLDHIITPLNKHRIKTFSSVKSFEEGGQAFIKISALIMCPDNLPERTSGAISKTLIINCQKLDRILEEEAVVAQHRGAFGQLTHREKEITTWVALGFTSMQIADRLCIARFTVDTHRKNINRKLGIQSLYQLLHIAQAFDLV